jgi:hypothetical protein
MSPRIFECQVPSIHKTLTIIYSYVIVSHERAETSSILLNCVGIRSKRNSWSWESMPSMSLILPLSR